VFNLGIGMVVAVPSMDAYKALDRLRAAGHKAVEIGTVTDGDGRVNVVPS
jgi:phosphoribosylaminoimidazole (AIR) synthetase